MIGFRISVSASPSEHVYIVFLVPNTRKMGGSSRLRSTFLLNKNIWHKIDVLRHRAEREESKKREEIFLGFS